MTESATNPNIFNLNVTYTPFGHTYNMRILAEPGGGTCYILNGAEIISEEIVRFEGWIQSFPSETWLFHAINYFAPDEINSVLGLGLIDIFRLELSQALNQTFGCTTQYYQVGVKTMDLSGLGNVLFGYYLFWTNVSYEDFVAGIEQVPNWENISIFRDNADDLTQRRLGRSIAEHSKRNDIGFIEAEAVVVGLF